MSRRYASSAQLACSSAFLEGLWGPSRPPHRRPAEDAGVTLIEIVVSVFLLALLSMGIIPVLAQGLTQSADVGTRAAANQLLSTRMELLRTGTVPACGTTTTASLPVSSGRAPLTATITRAACPTPAPQFGTSRVDVRVVRTDTGRELSSASTLLYVSTG